jgi:hypothetical protein
MNCISNKLAQISVLIAALFVFCISAEARLEPQKISSSDVIANGRAVFDTKSNTKANAKGSAAAKALAVMKKARLAGDYKLCTTSAAHARKSAPNLAVWVAIQELECANLLFAEKKDNSRIPPAVQAADHVAKTSVAGAQVSRLRTRLVEARRPFLKAI